MSLYMTEAEQLESMKKWWIQHQRLITTLLFVILLAVSGVRYWNWHREKINEQASTAYQNLMRAAAVPDDKTLQSYANVLLKQDSSSVYARSARLALAKMHVDHGEVKQAIDQLAVVAHHAKPDVLQQIATLRLARLLMVQKEWDKALNELATIEHAPFAPLVNELRGDIFVAMGNYPKAAEAYQTALRSITSAGVGYRYLEMKNNAVASMIQSKREGHRESKIV